MTIWTVRLGLSLMIVIGFWTNPLPAQQILLVPAVPYEPAQQPPGYFLFTPRPQPSADHGLHRALNKHGVACQADGYYNTCAGWRYEARFIFGSCSSFFNQPCEPGKSCDKNSRR